MLAFRFFSSNTEGVFGDNCNVLLLPAKVLPLIPNSMVAEIDSLDIKLTAIEEFVGRPKIKFKLGAANALDVFAKIWDKYAAAVPNNSERLEISIFIGSRYE